MNFIILPWFNVILEKIVSGNDLLSLSLIIGIFSWEVMSIEDNSNNIIVIRTNRVVNNI
jgi:hypothetical protein